MASVGNRQSPDRGFEAIDAALVALAHRCLKVARARAVARCVDGQIIGTGQADFTRTNATYTLRHQERQYQLLDAPGIEGDEQRFSHLVAQAIAKAHLVFFVNGTNKKPEATTVKKIKRYLGRGTQVCVLVNVKEYADAYEFKEDRTDLCLQPSPRTALRQTEDTLSSVIGPAKLLEGQCVQGLLAFAALATDPSTGRSTVHPTRRHDLGVHQRKFLSAFGSAEAMRRFSRIDEVAGVLAQKARTFQQDIIEANKAKVRELLASTIVVLGTTLADHEAFMARVEQELAVARGAVEDALDTFSRLALGERQRQVNECFNGLDCEALAIVSEHFGDKVVLKAALEQAFTAAQAAMTHRLQVELEALLATLQIDLHRAVERLLQNLHRADFERQLSQAVPLEQRNLRLDPRDIQMDLGLGGWGRVALGVGSLAATGAEIGMIFPPWGAFIGAGVGLLVGAVLSVLSVISSLPERVRKAQVKIQMQLEASRAEALEGAHEAHHKLLSDLRGQVDTLVQAELEKLHALMKQPGEMVELQAQAMSRILRQLERMPHGIIQAVRH